MKNNYRIVYDRYVDYYNNGDTTKIRRFSELRTIRNELERQEEHFQNIINDKIEEIRSTLDYEFLDQRDEEEDYEIKNSLKYLIKNLKVGTKEAVSSFSKMWLSNLEDDLKEYISKYSPDKMDELAFISFDAIKSSVEKIKFRKTNLRCLDQILIDAIDGGFNKNISKWSELSPEIKQRFPGRPPDESADQEEIDEVVKELAEISFFWDKDEIKPTTIRDFLMDPFHPKYEKKGFSFTKEEKERFRKSKGYLKKSSLFDRVKKAIDKISQ